MMGLEERLKRLEDEQRLMKLGIAVAIPLLSTLLLVETLGLQGLADAISTYDIFDARSPTAIPHLDDGQTLVLDDISGRPVVLTVGRQPANGS